MYEILVSTLKDYLGLSGSYIMILAEALTFFTLLISTYFLQKLLTLFAKKPVHNLLSRRKGTLPPFLMKLNTPKHLFDLFPPLIMLAMVPVFFDEASNPHYKFIEVFLDKTLKVYFIFRLGILIDNLMSVFEAVYRTYPISNRWPIKTYLQSIKIFIFSLLGIVVVSTLIGKSPQTLLAGIGAAGAIIMLVFKDSILSFVANIQMSSANILKVGDWIEIPSEGISGTVLEVSLTTVKIENFDKTISTVPPSKIVSTSIKNWDGMKEAGGRRFTPSIMFDTQQVIPLTAEHIQKYETLPELKTYLESASKSPEKHTNLGAFRTYALELLMQDPRIHHEGFTLLVRLIQTNTYGYLPLQIYAFTKTTVWSEYEAIQSEIIEHLISIAPFFSLKVMRTS